MRNEPAGIGIGDAAFDAFDDFELILDIGLHRRGGEKRFAAAGVGGNPLELLSGFRRDADRHRVCLQSW